MKPKDQRKIKVSKNGPYIVKGGIPLSKQTIITDDEGFPYEWRGGEEYPRRESYSLCRCMHACGAIPVESADGVNYEVRNRVTLCRCGKSSNKPFCDGGHIEKGRPPDGTRIG